ncbi:PBP1A family penicillin-binding protein [Ignavigranum ruoffiae]|uniref:PBP1A family penicillin-binding protein n=1 Tax=Ignavigranum ruoffiae TaxID=89093 RepID=UPI00206B3E00|nr:PBP1A family penicillin-binding protein [Ignavigranum ruoffiae]UPQ85260.1 PBP1A family penicillin-binding protein [Ignavigranum ruoffiae]
MAKEKWQAAWATFKELWRYYRGWKWLIFIGLSFSLVLSSYLVLIAKTTSVETLKDALQTKTTIYTANDEEAGYLSNQKGTYVTLDQVSDQMKKTLVATEDKRFYEHNGFDTMGIGRAFIRLLINRNTSGGGGSTLTQQLAKNAFLSQDQTFQRKFKELFLALEIEKSYDKEQILEMYLNHAYFGNGVWGVEDASEKYFGHPAASLNWNESIVLTGILKGPNIFNPIDDYQAAIDRRNVIADLLLKEQVITAEDHQIILSRGIDLWDNYYVQDSYTYPSYFDAVINEAIAKTNIPEGDLIGKGYKIYTYLNPAYQNALDQSYQVGGIFPDDAAEQPLVQSASIVVDPSTGGVEAVYGGRGEYTYRGFNRATDMLRSPGSTLKPLAVYVPALEAGYNIHSMVPDEVRSYNGYAPENYNHYTEPSGETPLYYALAQSKNTSAVYLMDKLGIDKSVKKLQQFGIDVKNNDKHLPLALGAFERGISPMQLANAYTAFANQGIRLESSFIRKIEDAQGNEVYNNERPTKHMVMTKNVAADMTSMMLDTYGGYGTAYGAGPDLGQIAGKTGSTETVDGSADTRDKWMVGYTPDFVIVTWLGLDEMGDTSLDTIMPSGLGSLFNIQTTNIMALSAQTPFQVSNASAMNQDTNTVADDFWSEQLSPWFDQASQWLGQQAESLWQMGQELADQAGQGLADLWNQIDLPW